MNKELELLRIIENFNINYEVTVKYEEGPGKTYKYKTIKDMFSDEFEIIEAAIKENFKMKLVIIAQEKEAKALRIIRDTRVDTNLIKKSKDYDDYCSLEASKLLTTMESPTQKGITEEEYNIIKEVLK